MAIDKINKLNYGKSVTLFKASVKRLQTNWEKIGNTGDPYDFVKDMFWHAATKGNFDITKYLWENYKDQIDLNYHYSNMSGTFKYLLPQAIYNGNGTGRHGGFREICLFMLENGADPAIGNNDALLAAKKSSIDMFDGENYFGHSKGKVGHDIVVQTLIKNQRVVEKVFELEQEQFYYLFPGVEGMFIF
jgi:hypothetical protein